VYQSYYNLTGKPFRLSPDPAFFFPSRGHKRALAYLRYGLNQDEGFVVITGSPGTGKTTLAKILLQEMDASVVVAHLTTTQLEADDMLRMVAASFGLRYEGLDKAGLLKSLEHFLLARSREHKRALLVIDEAQNLPSRSLEELRMLSNLQVGDKALLQIFLLGQEQFRHMLDNPTLEQLRQRVIANYHLTPLGADECQRYVESRLNHVGWNNDPHFAEIAHELIHQYSDGIPRRINMLCDRILLYGCMEETHEITGEVVNLVKAELDEEISGNPVNASDSGLRANGRKSAAAKPQSPASQQHKPELSNHEPQQLKAKSEPQKPAEVSHSADSGARSPQKSASQDKVPATGLENLGLENLELENLASENKGVENQGLTHSATAFDDSDLNEEFEDLDIDYAMFEDQNNQDQKIEEQKSAYQNEVKRPAEKPVEKPVVDRANTKASNAKSFQSAISELEEKLLKNGQPASFEKSANDSVEKAIDSKATKESPKSPVKKPQAQQPAAEQPGSSNHKRVMGNTVQKPKPETVKTDGETPAQHTEISERDLFRVIPGGKSFKIPGLGDSDDKPAVAASANAEPSSSDVRLRRILRLVLAFHRSPSRFPGLDTPAQPLPEGITELLELAISDDQVLNQVSPAAVMGISPVMLRAAVRFFVRRALFTPEGDHYRTLGLHPGASLAQIEKHYDLLMRLLRQDKQRGSADSVERVGQAYEALSRGEHAPKTSNKPQRSETKPVFEDVLPADGSADKDNSDLIIDFDDVENNPPKPPPPTFVAKPNERFNTVANGKMSRKTVRYASQLAVLGFGALVIILGLYIVQLEPSQDTSAAVAQTPSEANNSNTVTASQGNAGLDSSSSERQRGLLFNDGSADSLPSPSRSATATINAEAESTQALDQEPAREPNVVEALRQESMANAAAIEEQSSESASNHESPLVSSLDFDPEKISSQRSAPDASARVSSSPSRLEASSAPVGDRTVGDGTVAAVAAMETPAMISDPAPTSKQSANQFEGRDIEISDNQTPQRESFSSIAARTQTAKTGRPATSAPAAVGTAVSTPAPLSNTPPLVQLAEAPTPAPQSVKPQSTVKINETELINLVDNFLAYYASADLDKVMGLFASDARTNNRTNAQGIRSDYTELFKSTTMRKMNIGPLQWSIENDYARGIGDYQARINPVGTQNSQTFSGNITIQVQKDDQGLKITRFYFSNQTVSTGPRIQEGGTAAAPAAPQPAPVVAAAAAPQASTPPAQTQSGDITAKDLQNLVNKFAQTYANGDIDGLMSLFANNAKTNDQTTIAGIRKDYVDLFKGTNTRQMIINNMKWTLSGEQATGQGPFEVRVQPKGNNSTTVVKGSLKMTVIKNGGSSQVTEMIHTVE
jgi:putative secretion ATPase (PEP-CTERM system associated)